MGEVVNKYFALVFTKEKNMEKSEISIRYANNLEHVEIKKVDVKRQMDFNLDMCVVLHFVKGQI